MQHYFNIPTGQIKEGNEVTVEDLEVEITKLNEQLQTLRKDSKGNLRNILATNANVLHAQHIQRQAIFNYIKVNKLKYN